MNYLGVDQASAPAGYARAVTRSDTASITDQPPKALYVGTGGDLVAVFGDDSTVTFKNVASGALLPIRPKRVNATGTTAADIVALY
jgi:hypothetical protein